MKKLILLLAALLSQNAFAEGANVSNACTISWTPSTDQVSGYNVYTGTTPTNATLKRTTSTSSISCLNLGVVVGQNYAHVTAFNVVGEGAASDAIPFFVVGAAPQKVLGLTIK